VTLRILELKFSSTWAVATVVRNTRFIEFALHSYLSKPHGIDNTGTGSKTRDTGSITQARDRKQGTRDR
jgi:hypothetical protein